MKTILTFCLVLTTYVTFASLPPEGKYIDFYVKNHSPNGHSYEKQYPLKFKYAVECPVIEARLKNFKVKFPQFDRNLFAMMVPCLKLNYKLTKENVSFPEQEELIANFKNWLKTCPEENLIDIIDVANTLDLPESRKLAAVMLDRKIRTRLKKNVYSQEDIKDLQFRRFSFAKQFLSNLRNSKVRKSSIENKAPEVKPISWLAWMKSFISKKQDASHSVLSESKELVRYKASPFKQIKFPKSHEDSSWFGKLKEWAAYILWK